MCALPLITSTVEIITFHPVTQYEKNTRKLRGQKHPLIAYGAIKNISDIAFAIALGAECVMLGRLFAAMPESLAKNMIIDGVRMKYYQGMSRKEIIDPDMEAENLPQLVEMTSSIKSSIHLWNHKLKIAIVRSGQTNIAEFRTKSLLELGE